MGDSGIPCYDRDRYVGDFEDPSVGQKNGDFEEPSTGQNFGDFEQLDQDEIAAARVAEPRTDGTDGFEVLDQDEIAAARRATGLDYLFAISAAAARIDAALDGINSVSATLADEALVFAEKVSSAANGYGIFGVKETDEELLAEFESQFGDDGWA